MRIIENDVKLKEIERLWSEFM